MTPKTMTGIGQSLRMSPQRRRELDRSQIVDEKSLDSYMKQISTPADKTKTRMKNNYISDLIYFTFFQLCLLRS